MALTGVLTNVLRYADGNLASGIVVSAKLVPNGAFRLDDASEVVDPLSVVSAATGAWSMTLEQNSNIFPAGSYWEINEQLTAEQPRIWSVLIGSGFQTLESAIAAPPAPGPIAISLSANNTWSGSTSFTGPVGFNGATPVGRAAAPVTLADVIGVLRTLGLTS